MSVYPAPNTSPSMSVLRTNEGMDDSFIPFLSFPSAPALPPNPAFISSSLPKNFQVHISSVTLFQHQKNLPASELLCPR